MKTRISLKHIAWIIGLITSTASLAAEEPARPPAEPTDIQLLKKATDKFMEELARDKTKDAFDRLFSEWWLATERWESDSASLVAQLQRIEGNWQKGFEKFYGKLLPDGIEFLGARRLSGWAVSLIYQMKGERKPCVFWFSFYRAPIGWKLNNVSIDGLPAQTLAQLLGVTAAQVSGSDEIELKKATDSFLERLSQGEAKTAIEEFINDYWYDEEGKAEAIDELER